jgi:hypothetical protein
VHVSGAQKNQAAITSVDDNMEDNTRNELKQLQDRIMSIASKCATKNKGGASRQDADSRGLANMEMAALEQIRKDLDKQNRELETVLAHQRSAPGQTVDPSDKFFIKLDSELQKGLHRKATFALSSAKKPDSERSIREVLQFEIEQKRELQRRIQLFLRLGDVPCDAEFKHEATDKLAQIDCDIKVCRLQLAVFNQSETLARSVQKPGDSLNDSCSKSAEGDAVVEIKLDGDTFISEARDRMQEAGRRFSFTGKLYFVLALLLSMSTAIAPHWLAVVPGILLGMLGIYQTHYASIFNVKEGKGAEEKEGLGGRDRDAEQDQDQEPRSPTLLWEGSLLVSIGLLIVGILFLFAHYTVLGVSGTPACAASYQYTPLCQDPLSTRGKRTLSNTTDTASQQEHEANHTTGAVHAENHSHTDHTTEGLHPETPHTVFPAPADEQLPREGQDTTAEDSTTDAHDESPTVASEQHPEATVRCSGCSCTSSHRTTSGTISDGPSNYQDRANCMWLISSTAEISLSFTSFATEAVHDYVTINRCISSSCDPATVEEVATLTGKVDLSHTYKSSTGYLQVVFNSDDSVNKDGFVATWRIGAEMISDLVKESSTEEPWSPEGQHTTGDHDSTDDLHHESPPEAQNTTNAHDDEYLHGEHAPPDVELTVEPSGGEFVGFVEVSIKPGIGYSFVLSTGGTDPTCESDAVAESSSHVWFVVSGVLKTRTCGEGNSNVSVEMYKVLPGPIVTANIILASSLTTGNLTVEEFAIEFALLMHLPMWRIVKSEIAVARRRLFDTNISISILANSSSSAAKLADTLRTADFSSLQVPGLWGERLNSTVFKLQVTVIDPALVEEHEVNHDIHVANPVTSDHIKPSISVSNHSHVECVNVLTTDEYSNLLSNCNNLNVCIRDVVKVFPCNAYLGLSGFCAAMSLLLAIFIVSYTRFGLVALER